MNITKSVWKKSSRLLKVYIEQTDEKTKEALFEAYDLLTK